jgi:superfamily I DNA/RNA helicase
MANALIAHNSDRIAGRVLTERQQNGPGEVVVRQYSTASAEAEAVADKIAALVQSGVAPSEIIVLAQRATFGTPIFERLRARGIPTKSYYAETELDTLGAQERFALLKLLLNKDDRVALRWLLGRGHTSWYAAPYARVVQYVRQNATSPWVVLEQLANGNIAIPHTSALVTRFREIRGELAALEQATDLDQFIQIWLPHNLETALLAETVARCRPDAASIQDLYDALFATITQPEVPLEVTEVRVMSLHKSKGLSSHYVFIVGCVEGLLPARPDPSLTVDERAAKLREDRRLFYVGITRVKAALPARTGYLALTYAETMASAAAYRSQIAPVRVAFGVAHLQASRFLGEMAAHLPAPLYNTPL